MKGRLSGPCRFCSLEESRRKWPVVWYKSGFGYEERSRQDCRIFECMYRCCRVCAYWTMFRWWIPQKRSCRLYRSSFPGGPSLPDYDLSFLNSGWCSSWERMLYFANCIRGRYPASIYISPGNENNRGKVRVYSFGRSGVLRRSICHRLIAGSLY